MAGDEPARPLGDLIREHWSSLLADGFEPTEEHPERVVMTSNEVQIAAVLDPRGEVDVSVEPRGRSWPQRWTYTGVAGRASVARLLDLALVEMRSDPGILEGDLTFYEQLGNRNEADSQAWTAYYAGSGPRPGERRLP